MNISFDHLFKQEEKKQAYITTQHQQVGIEYAKKLGADKKQYGSIIRLVKLNSSRAAQAYSYAIDYPNARNPIKIFFWKYYHPNP